MAAKGGIENNIEPGLVARVVAGARYALTGKADWFGPGQPLQQTAPEDVRGRQFQMPIEVNVTNTIKADGIGFSQLRMFADACDIVRLLIETRKDQLCAREWTIKAVEKKGAVPKVGETLVNPDAVALSAFFKRPDKDHGWTEWLRLLLEDLFVLDAPTLYVQRTVGGDLYALRPIDGATIKRIIDTHGWTPMAPDPAYQQVLQGLPATNYTTDELVYRPRNPRTHRIYGYSPVEQIIITAKLLLSRQASNIEFYETGNLPEGFLEGAPGWTPEQLAAYQAVLDAMLSGNLAERRKVRAVPNGSKYQAVKEPALKQEFDEWLARIACFAFGYPPQPFIRELNRSTSDNAKESAGEEGEAPIARWVKELMDDIIQNRLNLPELEFCWDDKEAQDPLERAKIDQIYVTCGVLLPDEVREDLGRGPKPKPDPAETPPVADGAPAPTGEEGEDGAPTPAKVQKAAPPPGGGDAVGPFSESGAVDFDRPAAVAAHHHLTEATVTALELAAEQAAAAASAAIDAGETSADIIASQISLDALGELNAELTAALTDAATDAAAAAIDSIGLSVNVGLVDEGAVAWAKARAASLITADGTGGELLDTTRDLIRSVIAEAVEGGWSSDQLAKALSESFAFSAERAQTIARTEICFAAVSGSMRAWIESGVVTDKVWLLGEKACDSCIANAEQGPIPLLQPFASGDIAPPAHPNCVCSIAPITQ